MLLQLYIHRLSRELNPASSRVIFLDSGQPHARYLGDRLEKEGCALLGDHFVRIDHFSFSLPVSTLFPEVVKDSEVFCNAYGEISFLCVSAFTDFALEDLWNAGVTAKSRIIPELCGDRVVGKEELFK